MPKWIASIALLILSAIAGATVGIMVGNIVLTFLHIH